MKLLECSLDYYLSSEAVFLDLNAYFEGFINFVADDEIWSIIGYECHQRIAGVRVTHAIQDIDSQEHETFINLTTNFDDVIIFSEFYKFLSIKYQSAVSFNGFSDETCGVLYQYTMNQELYLARVMPNELGKDRVVPYKKIESSRD